MWDCSPSRPSKNPSTCGVPSKLVLICRKFHEVSQFAWFMAFIPWPSLAPVSHCTEAPNHFFGGGPGGLENEGPIVGMLHVVFPAHLQVRWEKVQPMPSFWLLDPGDRRHRTCWRALSESVDIGGNWWDVLGECSGKPRV